MAAIVALRGDEVSVSDEVRVGRAITTQQSFSELILSMRRSELFR